MSASTGLVLAAGGITAANEALFAPLAARAQPWHNFNWRIIPATAIAALLLSGLDQVSPVLGRGLAATALVTVLFARLGNAPAPVENLATVFGASAVKNQVK